MASSLSKFTSLFEAIQANAALHADRDAVTYLSDMDSEQGHETLTYAALDARARAIAATLHRSCEPGDRVLLLYPEGIQFAAAFTGCLYAGVVAVPAPLPGRLSNQRRRVTAIAADASVAMVLTDRDSLFDVLDWAGSADLPPLECLSTNGDTLAADAEWTRPSLDRDSLALLQYTSGSTGDPKGVTVTHGNLLDNVTSLQEAFGLDDGSRFGSWIPHYHDMGLMGILVPPLLLGGSCVLMSPTTFIKRPHWWLRMVDEWDLTWSAGPNFAFELCTRQVTDDQMKNLDLSRWLFACNGSEPVRAGTITAFAMRFAPAGLRSDALNPCYGMAEATVFVSGSGRREPVIRRVDEKLLAQGTFEVATGDGPWRELVGCGSAHDSDLRIVDPDTLHALPDGRIGEIWLRGPSISQGYWNNPEATNRSFRAQLADGEQEFLRTGDLGTLQNGELFITGRIKETLILRGRNLYPQDIEYGLRDSHPELTGLFGAAFTVTVKDDGDDEDVLVVLHEVRGRPPREQLTALASAVRRTLSREFGVHAAGVQLLRRGAVRRTTSGKIQRLEMREMFLAGTTDALLSEATPRLASVLP
ncbi:fatty acyl-AMP ligase [Streptomyces europaeiscabiei]|uniref:fatty acyl-AMP ligase n=1 Tax=Streptomyces europaeiscabiei TaxID=146819 RepID=UPI002E17F13C